MQVYFPTEVPQQAIGAGDFFNSIRVKPLILELLKESEDSLTVEPGTDLFIGHWWADMIYLRTEPSVDSGTLPQTRLL